MHLTFNVERLLLPVTVDLQQKLQHIATQHDLPTTSTSALTFNFRDTGYSAESGGWLLLKFVSSRKMVNGVSVTSRTLAMLDILTLSWLRKLILTLIIIEQAFYTVGKN